METEGSLLHVQVPATCPYPEPDLTSPYPPLRTSWRTILILCSHLRLGLPSGAFPSGFNMKNMYTFDSVETTNEMQPCNRIHYSTVH